MPKKLWSDRVQSADRFVEGPSDAFWSDNVERKPEKFYSRIGEEVYPDEGYTLPVYDLNGKRLGLSFENVSPTTNDERVLFCPEEIPEKLYDGLFPSAIGHVYSWRKSFRRFLEEELESFPDRITVRVDAQIGYIITMDYKPTEEASSQVPCDILVLKPLSLFVVEYNKGATRCSVSGHLENGVSLRTVAESELQQHQEDALDALNQIVELTHSEDKYRFEGLIGAEPQRVKNYGRNPF